VIWNCTSAALLAAAALTGCGVAVSQQAYDRDLAAMRQQADGLEAQKRACGERAATAEAALSACRDTAAGATRERELCKEDLGNTKKVLDECASRSGGCAKSLVDCQMARLKGEDDLRKLQADLNAAAADRDRLLRDHKALADALQKVQEGVSKVRERLDRLVAAGKLRIKERGGFLVIEVSSDILFDLGKAEVKPAARPVLAEIAEALKALADRRVQIAGHTDDTGGDEVNWRLSTDRALAALREMVAMGVSAKALSAAGFGPHLPVAPNDSDANRAKNRRVEFLLVPDLGELLRLGR